MKKMNTRTWVWILGGLIIVFCIGGTYLTGCGGRMSPVMWSASWYGFFTGPSEYMRELDRLCSFKPVTQEDVYKGWIDDARARGDEAEALRLEATLQAEAHEPVPGPAFK